jgi:hypothetical protein
MSIKYLPILLLLFICFLLLPASSSSSSSLTEADDNSDTHPHQRPNPGYTCTSDDDGNSKCSPSSSFSSLVNLLSSFQAAKYLSPRSIEDPSFLECYGGQVNLTSMKLTTNNIIPSSPHHDASHSLDVISLAVKPTCVHTFFVRNMNQFVAGVRRIIFITAQPDYCPVFEQMGPNVVCLDQDRIAPGLTIKSVERYIAKHWVQQHNFVFEGRKLSGWYFQQLIKLAAADYIEGLGDFFLIWDPDMIPLWPIELFPVWEDNGATFKTTVNVGGYPWLRGYGMSYEKLFGEKIIYAPDGSSFVTHWIVVYKPFMREMLSFLQPNLYQPNPTSSSSKSSTSLPESKILSWPWKILKAVSNIDPEWQHMGFSEYFTYISWVRSRHPETQHVLPTQVWKRYPDRPPVLNADGNCCPSEQDLCEEAKLGTQYLGWELGHEAQRCDPEWLNPRYNHHYP